MDKKLSLSVILPLKSSLVKDFQDYFSKAIESLKSQKVQFEELLIVHSSEEKLIDFLNNFDFGNLNVKKIQGKPNPILLHKLIWE